MKYAIIKSGESRSFPKDDPILAAAVGLDAAEVVIYCGTHPEPNFSKKLILVELGDESLAEHVGETGYANILGFARYRNGTDAPSNLIELVKQQIHSEEVLGSAREFFQALGYQVAVSGDQIGRIVNRLVLPKYNAALRFLDEGLATQQDMDLTCKLGLGYPDGPIERVVRGGLAHHFRATKALFETYGTSAYAPPRAAVVANRRERSGPKN